MKLNCSFVRCTDGPNHGHKVIDTIKQDPIFTNVSMKLPHEAVRYYCSTRHRTLGEEEARKKRPHLATMNGHDLYEVVNSQTERLF